MMVHLTGGNDVDITPYLGTIVSVVIAFGVFYGAVNARLARLEARIEDNQKLTQAEISNLRRDVEKHNNVVGRTTRLESDMSTAFKRIDELRAKDERIEDKLDDLRIGGTE